MKIALLTHSVNPRGGVVHTLELARALHGQGHDVTVMAPAEPGQTLFRRLPCRLDLIPVTVAPHNVAEMVADRIAAYGRHLERVVPREKFDILHAQDGINANALVDLRDRGVVEGFVRTVHHLDDFADSRLAAWQRRAVLGASTCLCVSDTWCERIHREYGIPVHRVSNGVDAARYSPRADERDTLVAMRLGLKPGEGPIFLTVGGVEGRKNTLRSLQAFVRVRARHPRARLIIAGGASLLDHSTYARRFDEALRESGLTSGPGAAVEILGRIDDADMPSLFRLADVVLMPSVKEGFGLVVLEALASGRPIVVSRIAPFTEYLDDSLCHWADPEDPQSIASAMETAVTATCGPLLRQAAEPLLQSFSWAASAARHIEVYEQHLERQRTVCTT